MKRIIIDLDGTLTVESDLPYHQKEPNMMVVQACREYKEAGFEIVISTSRNMRTWDGNIGKINVHTLPLIMDWLKRHDIPFDEVYVGKPWCGFEGFYVDDKSIRPSEFSALTYQEITELLAREHSRESEGER